MPKFRNSNATFWVIVKHLALKRTWIMNFKYDILSNGLSNQLWIMQHIVVAYRFLQVNRQLTFQSCDTNWCQEWRIVAKKSFAWILIGAWRGAKLISIFSQKVPLERGLTCKREVQSSMKGCSVLKGALWPSFVIFVKCGKLYNISSRRLYIRSNFQVRTVEFSVAALPVYWKLQQQQIFIATVCLCKIYKSTANYPITSSSRKKTVFTAQKSSLIFLSFERTGNVMSQSMF